MKRIVTVVIALIIAAVVCVAHARGWLAALENPLMSWAQHDGVAARDLGNAWQFILVTLLAVVTALFTVETARLHRVVWLVLALVAELLVLSWICSLYGILFRPLPSIIAAVLSYAGAIGWLAWNARPPRPARPKREKLIEAAPPKAEVPEPIKPAPAVMKPLQLKPKPRPPAPVLPSAPSKTSPPEPAPAPPLANFDGTPRTYETTVLVCDLPDKYELADNQDPDAAASAFLKFGDRAADLLTKAGAHLHRNDGEGVVAFFGFPAADSDHAEKAVRAAFDLQRAFAEQPIGSNGDSAPGAGVHVGISSGSIVASRPSGQRDIFVLGETVELARRFCVANRFYGSRILIGPRTFEMADRTVVARPIDFLSGVTAQERHEIYEPLAPAADAPAELLARRDSFWNGVVLYREKRWAEAYAAFQQARGTSEAEDAPLNLYLRRLEPLALHYAASDIS